MIQNKRIFITGGAGYLGRNIIKKYYKDNEITVYSRDESKHYYLLKDYPKIKTIIGDIRNYDLLKRSSMDHNIGIFAASLKQIEAVDQNVEESIKIMINGAINSRRIAEENNYESACFISSDKSRSPTTLYGAMKFIAGESFIIDAEKSNVKLSSAIYGNVINSTGSIIPLIWKFINQNKELILYDKHMTRFNIDIDNAINLIEYGLLTTGFNIIPDIKSFKIYDLFEIYNELFGLKYKIGSPRISEKIHEIMISKEEIPRTKKQDNFYLMHYKNIYNELSFKNDELSSKDFLMTKDELNIYLKTFNYFKV